MFNLDVRYEIIYFDVYGMAYGVHVHYFQVLF